MKVTVSLVSPDCGTGCETPQANLGTLQVGEHRNGLAGAARRVPY